MHRLANLRKKKNAALKCKPNSPGGDVVDLGFTKGTRLCSLHARVTGNDIGVGCSVHDVRKVLIQEAQQVTVDLIKLQKEGVVAVWGVDGLQLGIGDVRRKLLLLSVSKQAIRLDTEYECGLLDQREGMVQSRYGIQALFVFALRVAVPRDIVGVQLARNGNVAIGVEAFDELLALVAQVRLGRKVVLGQRLGSGACGRIGSSQGRGGRVRGVVELEIGRLGCLRGGIQCGAAVGARGESAGRAGVLVAVVVDGPVLVGGRGGMWDRVDALLLGQVGRVASKAGLERIATAVGQEGRHACSAQAGGRRVLEGVVAVVVLGVAVDALALRLAPADAPGAVACGRGDGGNGAHVVAAEVGKLQHEHAAHGAANDCRDLLDAEVVQDEPEEVDIVADRRQWELGPVALVGGVSIACRHRARAAVRAAQAVHAHDEEPRRVEGLARPAQQGPPPVAYVGAPRQRVADNHGVVPAGREGAVCFVCHRDIVNNDARLQFEFGDDGKCLVGDQAGVWVLGLRSRLFCRLVQLLLLLLVSCVNWGEGESVPYLRVPPLAAAPGSVTVTVSVVAVMAKHKLTV
jgi:hypothetical protein